MADNLMMIGALQSGKADITDSFEAAPMQIAESITAKTDEILPTK